MTAVLKEELKHWLKRLEMDEAVDPERYRNSGMLLRLPNGLAVEPILIRKKSARSWVKGSRKASTSREQPLHRPPRLKQNLPSPCRPCWNF